MTPPQGLIDTALGALRLFLLFIVALGLPLLLQLWLLFVLGRLFQILVTQTSRPADSLLGLIGVPVHEFSHALASLLVLRPVRAIKFIIDEAGYAFVLSQPSRLFGSFVSVAPLLGGVLVLWLTGLYILPAFQVPAVDLPALDLHSASSFGTVLRESLDFLGRFFQAMLVSLPNLAWGNWRTYVGLYIALSVASSIAPSPPDIRNFYRALPFALLALFLLFAGLYATGNLEARFPALQQALLPHLLALSTVITYAFVLTLLGVFIFLPLRLLARH